MYSILKTFNFDKEERRLNEEGMESTIDRLNKAGLLDEEWTDFLHKVRVLRDEVHMDRDRDKNIQNWLNEIEISGIREKINDFRKLVYEIILK